MSKSKWQRLLGAALVAALLTTTMAPAAMAAVPAAAAQQVTNASEITALLPGGQFSKIWLALTPSNPGTVTVTAEWDRENALETGVGVYVLDENNLAAVVNGASLPANNVGSGSSNFFLNGSSNLQGSSFRATGTAYTVVLYNDSNADANVTLRVENGTISDDSGQVQDPNAADTTDEATPAAAAEAAPVEATAATTDTATTDTATTDTATTVTTTVAAATPVATAAAPVATVVAGGPVRAESMEGSLPEQFNQHFLGLEPSIRDGNISLVLTYDPQDSTELSRRINFWVLDTAGFQSYQDGESASAVAIAAGSRSFLDPDTSNKREASFQATGFGPYTVIVQNNSRVPATYQLAITGGVLVDDSAQTLTAQQASGSVTGTATTTTTVAAATTTTDTTTATTATTTATAAAGTGVAGTPGGTYTVVAGDTLAIIARDIYGDYRLYEQLCAFNNIADCNTIEIGQVINLPTEAEIGSVAAAPAAAAPVAATPAATVAAAPATTTAATTTVTSTTPVTGTSPVTTTAAATRTTTTTATTTAATTAAAASGTIVDVASEAGNFTILLDALQQAELDAALAGSGPFTVFAPTDAAFEALLSGNNLTEEQLLAAKELVDILQYHVLTGQVLAADMTNGSRATTLQGKPVTFEVRDGSVFVNGAELVTTDIVASNGVIHAIDAVILPPQS